MFEQVTGVEGPARPHALEPSTTRLTIHRRFTVIESIFSSLIRSFLRTGRIGGAPPDPFSTRHSDTSRGYPVTTSVGVRRTRRTYRNATHHKATAKPRSAMIDEAM